MQHELGLYDEVEPPGGSADRPPAIVGIDIGRTPAEEGDAAMTQCVEMPQCQLGGPIVIDGHSVCLATTLLGTREDHRRHR